MTSTTMQPKERQASETVCGIHTRLLVWWGVFIVQLNGDITGEEDDGAAREEHLPFLLLR